MFYKQYAWNKGVCIYYMTCLTCTTTGNYYNIATLGNQDIMSYCINKPGVKTPFHL